MKLKNILFFIGILFVIQSCNVEPAPIEFGKDQCNFCKMNIVDKVHAAQYVTKKGKQFKFDAIECMVDEVNGLDQYSLSILLVSDYANPGIMTNALEATYLISPNLKSPMGANLTGFANETTAKKAKAKHEGELLNWEKLKAKRKK